MGFLSEYAWIVTRFWRKVSRSKSCWEWTGSQFVDGYGAFSPTHEERVKAHRFSFLLANGYLPEVIDHLCMNKLCVRPHHLEAVSQSENMKRYWQHLKENRKKGCKHSTNGFNEQELTLTGKLLTVKKCGPCRRSYMRSYYRKNKARMRDYFKQWRGANREKVRIYSRRSKARVRASQL